MDVWPATTIFSCALTQLWRLAPFAVELQRVPWKTTWTVGHALDGGLYA